MADPRLTPPPLPNSHRDQQETDYPPSGWGAFSCFLGGITALYLVIVFLMQLTGVKDGTISPKDGAVIFAIGWAATFPLSCMGLIAGMIGLSYPKRNQAVTHVGLMLNGFSVFMVVAGFIRQLMGS